MRLDSRNREHGETFRIRLWRAGQITDVQQPR